MREDEDGGLVCEVVDDGMSWGYVGMPVEFHDDEEVERAHAELLMVQVFESVFDNLWPDELTDAWPPCPVHACEPLQPRLVRGIACWTCTRDEAFTTPLGTL